MRKQLGKLHALIQMKVLMVIGLSLMILSPLAQAKCVFGESGYNSCSFTCSNNIVVSCYNNKLWTNAMYGVLCLGAENLGVHLHAYQRGGTQRCELNGDQVNIQFPEKQLGGVVSININCKSGGFIYIPKLHIWVCEKK